MPGFQYQLVLIEEEEGWNGQLKVVWKGCWNI